MSAGDIRPGVRLGVDVGDVRIGVARSDPSGLIATPVETVRRGAGDLARLRDQAQLVEELGYDVIYFPDHLVYEGPERQRMPDPAFDPMVMAAVAAQATLRALIPRLAPAGDCTCRTALQYALVTDPAVIPAEARQRLGLLLGRYLP